ncbi:hypothetical protein C8N46_101700 [Kordia periserrulae]|uniref:PA14 domain-containing protein n=1 Tax=Kordia periserrulae TaxID=701523 RepID=A0A2T6C6Z1_9FLAO|nr:hypothetical protein [Kordia periserrulae]PTX64090.1 hypothetical protein C8N46_101700 [Kordia periserrulae]
MIIQHIRTGKLSKVLACYLAMQLVLTTIQPAQLFALTSGPSQPEFNAFTPIGTSDMVNLSTGDFNYNIPIMDVGGYPLNLAYDAGITMDQEASWVGLGWNLNIGQINRNVRGLPDDFKGDLVTYENNMKKNKTVGMTLSINGQFSGTENTGNQSDGNPQQNNDSSNDGDNGNNSSGLSAPSWNASATLVHNNYEGFSFTPSFGVGFQLAKGTSVGMNLSPSVANGANVSPTVSFSEQIKDAKVANNESISQGYGIGLPYNSRQGITAFNISTSTTRQVKKKNGYTSNLRSRSAGASFIDNTFTPTKRIGYHNENYTFRASLGPQLAAFSFEGGVSAFYSVQRIKDDEQIKEEKTYGYEFTKYASHNDILDFNRENERIVTKNTLTLPVTNYTHDIYHIQGQGIAGQFRPFKGQTGYVFNQKIEDSGDSFSLGAEIEAGWGFRGGVDIHYSPTRSHTGVWNTPAIHKFQSVSNTELDYEETYFKAIGDLSADLEEEVYNVKLSGEKPMALDLTPDGNSYNKKAVGVFNVKNYDNSSDIEMTTNPISGPIRRTKREQRNQAIQKITKKEATFDPFVKDHQDLKDHHTNGIKITQPSGAVYVYGEAAVNHEKEEVTFAADGIADLETGTISIDGNDTAGSAGGFDNFFNKITTPNYAHTFLLSAVLSNDYEDLTGDGPTDDDLGAYTKMHYNNFVNSSGVASVVDDYKWQTPYAANTASYNPGFYTKPNDQKGSYVRGTKELKYVTMIETKTHVAIFDFAARDDAKDASDRNASLQIETIKLYSKPEAKAANLLDDDPLNNVDIAPIKTAYFEYDYSLMQNTPNSTSGKLTLKKVYFTYRNSKMGKYTPYVFNYDNYNPDYQMKSHDIWGNYKPLFEEGVTYDEDANGDITNITLPNGNTNASCEVQSDITAQEFPFVQQKDKLLQDYYTSAWTLSSIDLPSGGRIELQYESDDYQYVQDKKAMQMFKVAGVKESPTSAISQQLYNGENHKRYLVVELLETEAITVDQFKSRYLGENIDKPIFFRFLLNMEKYNNCAFDYVEGYVNIDTSNLEDFHVYTEGEKQFGLIPVQFEDLEGGVAGGTQVHPIAKSGWFFARKHLNRYAYGTGDDTPSSTNIRDIVQAIGSSLPVLAEIFIGPNGYLQTRGIAKTFIPQKSWIRLQHPTNAKLGGGLRVKKVKMHDNWDAMVNNPQSNPVNPYSNFYGQEYDYTLKNGGSSGVTTWEPNMSKENPLIQPFFDDSEKLQAREYVEKPFGKSFYPSATVTYSKVTVKNLQRIRQGDNNTNLVVKRHATGKVTNEFFTSKDFPTKSDHTDIDDKNNYRTNQENILDNVLRLSVKTELALSQGFSIITNDMNGKSKSQKIYDENENLISGVDYIYNINDTGELDNHLPVILSDGSVETKEIGTHYDVITDFNENYNLSESYGVNTNLTFFNVGIIPILLGQLPFEYKRNETTLHTTTTTKVIHKTGILKEKVAYDLGASVSTRNLAWDAVSGQVLLTETSNAYKDNYYNFSYPAHWAYKGMGQAVQNLGVTCQLSSMEYSESNDYDEDEDGKSTWYRIDGLDAGSITLDAKKLFLPGDQVMVFDSEGNSISTDNAYWISQVEYIGADIASGQKMVLIKRNGEYLNACGEDANLENITIKVVKSGYRNFQSAAMASVTTMTNPMDDGGNPPKITASDFSYNGTGTNPRIINASAIKYKDFWANPEENPGVDRYPSASFEGYEPQLLKYPNYYQTNPFIYNVKGDWRAVKSYAHLTTRSSTNTKRNSGFFESFSPFYMYDDVAKKWIENPENDETWTFASEVTQYSPYGAELENKDALGRYSSAQYGYNYKLPIAVASNSEYRQMGYDGFEDRDIEDIVNTHFRYLSTVNNANATITDEESHTGRYSIKVDGGHEVGISKRLYNDCIERGTKLDCEPEAVIPPGTPTCDYHFDNREDFTSVYISFNYGSDGPLQSGPSLIFNYSNNTSIEFNSYDSNTEQYVYEWIVPSNGEFILNYIVKDNTQPEPDTCGGSESIMITNGIPATNTATPQITLPISH